MGNLDLWAPVSTSNDYGARGKKKAANYQRNVKKAGVFEDYTEFYTERGTNENGGWMKLPNGGHRMAKTKYDWSPSEDNPIPDSNKAVGGKARQAAKKSTKKFGLF